MKKLLTATFASLALFTFAPVEVEAGGKKKNKRAKVHKHFKHHGNAHRGHNHAQRGHNYGHRGQKHYKPRSSVRFSFGPTYRSYHRPAPRVRSYGRSYHPRPSFGFSGLSLFFGGGGGHCR